MKSPARFHTHSHTRLDYFACVIPWNPTRVIQRVGRINRIGTMVFSDLYLFNFFPTEQGAREHNVRQIATNKMFMIHTSIGEDSKILDADEKPTPGQLLVRL